MVGRQFSGPGAYLGPIPTLTLVLKPYAASRGAAVCQAFLKIRTYEAVLAESVLVPNAIPLRWPLTGPPRDPNDCGEILAKYDYYAAAMLLGGVEGSTTTADGKRLDTSGPGPFVLEQYATSKGVAYAVLDFSRATQAGLSFDAIADKLQGAVQLQNNALNGGPAAPTVAPSAPAKPPSFFDKICSAIDSQLGKVIRTAFGYVPPTAVVATYVDGYDKAACAKPGA